MWYLLVMSCDYFYNQSQINRVNNKKTLQHVK